MHPHLTFMAAAPRIGPRRGYSVETDRGDARDVGIPWSRVATTPRLPRGYSAETSRGDAEATNALILISTQRTHGKSAFRPAGYSDPNFSRYHA